jgi:hypothetical protein
VVLAATNDKKFRADDADTGKVINLRDCARLQS